MSFCPMTMFPYTARSVNQCPVLLRMTKAESELRELFRMLWEQHGTWTRLTINSIVFGLPDEAYVTNRLLRNPEDFGAALEKYYGNKIASRFAQLLKEHLVIAAQLVKAAKAGNNAAAQDIEKRWYQNADELAAFLGSINPYWSEDQWREMLHTHLGLVKAEAVYLLNKDYSKSITAYDEMEKQVLEMADLMASGITRQFYAQPALY